MLTERPVGEEVASMAESMGGDVLGQVLQAVQGLSEQVKDLSKRMDKLETSMQRLSLDEVQTRNEINQARRELRAEILGVRTELLQTTRRDSFMDLHAVRMELQLGLHHAHERIDRTHHALFMRELGLYRTMG
ncbi:MAG TPA: LeoA/HP0731 family dynamin-like GTPase [Archangium sp.]|nr:LeoA/HP0731 family dynamin-like GTPase [Archangium sp.]